jgi:hypothetical protein
VQAGNANVARNNQVDDQRMDAEPGMRAVLEHEGTHQREDAHHRDQAQVEAVGQRVPLLQVAQPPLRDQLDPGREIFRRYHPQQKRISRARQVQREHRIRLRHGPVADGHIIARRLLRPAAVAARVKGGAIHARVRHGEIDVVGGGRSGR